MNIGLIGCGRVGTTMCYLLRRKNRIIGVYDVNKSKKQKTARILELSQLIPLETLCIKSTVLFIATPDNEIVHAYKTVESMLHKNMYIFHFSGALPSSVFPKKQGMYRAAVHPFATFPRLIIPPRRKNIPMYIEGDARARAVAKKIFQMPLFSPVSISKNNKIYCHLAGVFASNFIVALLTEIRTLMKKADLPARDVQKAILPIIKDALSNIEAHGLHRSLSGPLQRGDTQTIKKHVQALRHDSVLLTTYKILSLAIVETLPEHKGKKQLQKILKFRK